jgi:hypothetical protein
MFAICPWEGHLIPNYFIIDSVEPLLVLDCYIYGTAKNFDKCNIDIDFSSIQLPQALFRNNQTTLARRLELVLVFSGNQKRQC